jgi:hypothetical protein
MTSPTEALTVASRQQQGEETQQAGDHTGSGLGAPGPRDLGQPDREERDARRGDLDDGRSPSSSDPAR